MKWDTAPPGVIPITDLNVLRRHNSGCIASQSATSPLFLAHTFEAGIPDYTRTT
jgi:hypothetical protein